MAVVHNGGWEFGREGGTVRVLGRTEEQLVDAERRQDQSSSKVQSGSARPTMACKGIGPK